jgi:hypothetical protein
MKGVALHFCTAVAVAAMQAPLVLNHRLLKCNAEGLRQHLPQRCLH